MDSSGVKDYEIKKNLGKGELGVVDLYKNKIDKKYYVGKKIPVKNIKSSEKKIIFKISKLEIVKSPYVEKSDFVKEEGNKYVYLISKYFSNGNLKDFLEKNKKKINEELIWNIFIKICLGIGELHKNHISHGNLKTTNVFLLKDNTPVICDIGIVGILNNYINDISGLGVILSELFFLEISTDNKTGAYIFSQKEDTPPLSEELKGFIMKMIQNKLNIFEVLIDTFLLKKLNYFALSDNEKEAKILTEAYLNSIQQKREEKNKIIKAREEIIDVKIQTINYKFTRERKLLDKKYEKEKVPILDKENYERIADYVKDYIEIQMIGQFGLDIMYVPSKDPESLESLEDYYNECESEQCEIYVRDLPQKKKCLVLIQGSGPVSPGIWARSVCINEGLDLGSMFPFINWGGDNNCSIVILNPNQTHGIHGGKINYGYENDCEHCIYVFRNIILESAEELYIVAHSMGGVRTIDVLSKFPQLISKKIIKKIAFTDSVHGRYIDKLKKKFNKEDIEYFQSISKHYVASKEPVGKFLKSATEASDGVNRYSAGHNQHEYTTGTAKELIFKFFEEPNEMRDIKIE